MAALAVSLGLLTLSACGGRGKLSAAQAATKLMAIVTANSKVHCVPGKNGWDYACTVKPPHRARFTTDVDVNQRRITNVSG